LNNSLNFDLHCKIRISINSEEIILLRKKLFPLNDELPVVSFIGRLTREKKLDQLIESIDLLHQRGKKVNCLIIGTGQQENLLKNLVVSLKLQEYVNFYGPSYNESENGLLISLSECCISPGNVGLTAIHSMSFGTPVITHNDFSNQGPEASSIMENSTGELFEKNNIYSLTDKIEELVFKKGKKFYTGNCIKLVEDYYNPYYQINIFNDLIQFLTSPASDKFAPS
jgi:glycosyltransferase involved in cell wall biosynthesis